MTLNCKPLSLLFDGVQSNCAPYHLEICMNHDWLVCRSVCINSTQRKQPSKRINLKILQDVLRNGEKKGRGKRRKTSSSALIYCSHGTSPVTHAPLPFISFCSPPPIIFSAFLSAHKTHLHAQNPVFLLSLQPFHLFSLFLFP